VPELLSLYVGGHVHLETMVILNDFEDYLSKWKPLHMIWSDQFRILEKIKKFVKYDQDKLQSIYNQYKESLKEI
jgi:hypothetical protein